MYNPNKANNPETSSTKEVNVGDEYANLHQFLNETRERLRQENPEDYGDLSQEQYDSSDKALMKYFDRHRNSMTEEDRKKAANVVAFAESRYYKTQDNPDEHDSGATSESDAFRSRVAKLFEDKFASAPRHQEGYEIESTKPIIRRADIAENALDGIDLIFHGIPVSIIVNDANQTEVKPIGVVGDMAISVDVKENKGLRKSTRLELKIASSNKNERPEAKIQQLRGGTQLRAIMTSARSAYKDYFDAKKEAA